MRRTRSLPRFSADDPRFLAAQKLFLSGRADNADEARALLRELLHDGTRFCASPRRYAQRKP